MWTCRISAQRVEQATDGAIDANNNSPFAADGVPRALWWDEPARVLRLLDQTLLPGECVVIACATAAQVGEAIRTLQVRGAPAIGAAAAYGLALGARAALPAPTRSCRPRRRWRGCMRLRRICARPGQRR